MARRRAANNPDVRVELTPRQEQVLGLIAEGKTNGEIAGILGVTLDGAKWHVREIMARLGAESREEAVERWQAGRTLRSRLPGMKGWLGWPLVAGAGGVAAVLAGVVIMVALFGGAHPKPEPPEVVSREQPELTIVGEGDGWRVLADPMAAVPAPVDAALAVRWDNWPTEVAMVDVSTGRVAVRWETGYRPTAILRPSRNEVLISHHPINRQGQPEEPVLLRFRLDDLRSPPEVFTLAGRISYTVGITELGLSADERWLFYIADGYPGCVDESQGFGDSRGCVNQRVGALDLDDAAAPPLLYVVGNACGRFEPDSGNRSGVLMRCDNTRDSTAGAPQYFAVDARGAAELPDPPGSLSFGATSDLVSMPDGRLFGTRITEQYTNEQGLMLLVYSPPFRPPVNTDDTKRWTIPRLASAVPLEEPGRALGVMRDGRLVLIDLDTGVVLELAYRLTASPLDDWVLVR